MSETIEITVGSLYANLHDEYAGQIPEYDEQVRQQFENFIHNFHQEVERAQDAEANQAHSVDDG